MDSKIFFLPLTSDLCWRNKGRACNDHHCFIWLLPWQPLPIPPALHALPYRSSKLTKSGFHGYSFRAPLWLHSWKCWLRLVSRMRVWMSISKSSCLDALSTLGGLTKNCIRIFIVYLFEIWNITFICHLEESRGPNGLELYKRQA